VRRALVQNREITKAITEFHWWRVIAEPALSTGVGIVVGEVS
jgi:hypothetical protein